MPETKAPTSFLSLSLLVMLLLCGQSVLAAQTSNDKSPAEPQAEQEAKQASSLSMPEKGANALREIRQIAEGGAPALALGLLDQEQQSLKPGQSEWLVWEKERIQLYEQNSDWQKLLDRIAILPGGLPEEFQRWSKTRQVKSLLELDQGTAARKVLHHLLISTAGQSDEATLQWLKRWRLQIIMAYLSERKVEDAHIAILRFQQDYAATDLDTLLLRARILLMSQQPEEVVELLAKHTKQPQAGMLHLLAQLRSRQRTPVKVVQAGLRQMRGKWADKKLKRLLWAVVAEAAQQAGDRETAVIALEHVMASQPLVGMDKLFDFGVDHLWNAYIDYALYSGNKAQFLIGQDEKWFADAKKHFKKKAVKSRAYYALLLHRGQTNENKLRAADGLVNSLKGRKRGGRLMRKLFTESKYFSAITHVPEAARRSLVDVALAENNIPLASEIMATIKTAPKDNTGYMWYLRRARILVLGGQAGNGAQALQEFLLNQGKELDREKLDRLLQVVFDLQTVGAHEEAIGLFDKVTGLTDDEKLRRELIYWMADSYRAQEQYEAAAHYYLKSAMLPDGKGLDPWGQTARYQAAECLGKAGLVDDAHNLFSHLLRVTKESDRRAVLQHEIHKLRLSKAKNSQKRQARATAKDNNNKVVEQGFDLTPYQDVEQKVELNNEPDKSP